MCSARLVETTWRAAYTRAVEGVEAEAEEAGVAVPVAAKLGSCRGLSSCQAGKIWRRTVEMQQAQQITAAKFAALATAAVAREQSVAVVVAAAAAVVVGKRKDFQKRLRQSLRAATVFAAAVAKVEEAAVVVEKEKTVAVAVAVVVVVVAAGAAAAAVVVVVVVVVVARVTMMTVVVADKVKATMPTPRSLRWSLPLTFCLGRFDLAVGMERKPKRK